MKVSIIVPVYNVENDLRRCVDSLIVQTYRELEIILVDDGSTDGSPKICDVYSKCDQRVRVIHKANGGLSDARNAGRRIATGDYILYVDSDDWIEPDSCERLIKVANSTNADLIAGECVRETCDGLEYLCHSNLEDGKAYETEEFVKLCISARQWYAPAPFYMYSASMYQRAYESDDPLFFKEGIFHEDMEMQMRLFGFISSVAFCPGVFYHYVEREGSITTSSWSAKRLSDVRSIYSDWLKSMKSVLDESYKKVLLGHLAKCWLTSCGMSQKPKELSVDGIDWKFLFHYGLDAKEKIKALCFAISPKAFLFFWKLSK